MEKHSSEEGKNHRVMRRDLKCFVKADIKKELKKGCLKICA
jgi:hypothetical protein